MSHWEFSAPLPVVIFGLLLWIVAGWFCLQNWRRRGTTKGVGKLEILRFVIITLIAFTLLKPEFVKQIVEKESPEIAVLFDGSGSMQTRDVVLGEKNIIRRNEWLLQQRATRFWMPWQKNAKVVMEDFARPTADMAAGGAPREDGTDLNGTLDVTLQRYKRLKAVVLLTDGDWNLGVSPLGAATRYRARNIPVYSINIGSETYLPDISLQQVSAPAYGLLGEQVSIPYKIQSHLPREVKTVVSLTSPEGEELRKDVVIPAYSLVQDTLVWSPKDLGDKNLRLAIPVVEGEALEDNNEHSFRISIRTEKLKVLVVESLPRWEYRYLRNALVRDPGVEVNTLLFHPAIPIGDGSNYIKNFPESKEALTSYDVVFLGDVGVGENELTTNQLALVKGLVEQQGSGLVFLPGSRGRQYTLVNSPVGDLMPVILDDAKQSGISLPTESTLLMTSVGRGHFLTMLANDESRNEDVWKNLPGFFWCAGVQKSRPGSEVLGVHSALRNNSGRLPLLVTRPFGNGETLFMGTDAAWRWRRGVEDKYHYRFWGQVVRWMSHKRHLAAGKGVRLVYNPENPRVGESVYLNATVLDSNGSPVEKAPVYATIVAPSGQTERLELTGVPGGWGVFKGGFSAREGGRYKVTIASEKAARNLETEIIVTRIQREKQGQPVNSQILAEISDLTDGYSGGIKDMGELVNQITSLPELKPLEKRIKLWANPWWAGGIIFLFGIYWTGRKVTGMI